MASFLRSRLILLSSAAILFLAALNLAQSTLPPAPTDWVTDNAGFMSPAGVSELNARLAAYQQQTGHQLLVWIAPSLNGVPIEDFAVRAFQSWKVGRKGIDDGLVLFIFAQD